jgi:amidase
MARQVADLELALSVLAGPEDHEAVAYRLDLPAPRHDRLADFRVLVIDHHPVAETDGEIVAAVRAFAERIEEAGASVERQSELLPDLEAAFQNYLAILTPIISRGGPPQPDLASSHEWMSSLDQQWAFRKQWAALFWDFDVVVAPTFGVVAFEHQTGAFEERTLDINGEATPYRLQIAWPAVATLPNLPATALPIGNTKSGLPIGAQIIGPYLEDRTTLAFARLAAAL